MIGPLPLPFRPGRETLAGKFEDVNSFLARDQILTLLANTKGSLPAYLHKALFAQFQTSLRADSEGAPSTHREAKTTDESAGNSTWQDGERSELKNHEKNRLLAIDFSLRGS